MKCFNKTHKIILFSTLALALNACSSGSTSDSQSNADADENGEVGGATIACDAPVERMLSDSGVEFVRTPDACFDNLADFPQEALYVEIDGLRQAYVEAGPADGDVVLLLHGQPSWSYLYRKMIPVLADAGYRVIAMDHLGTGRSDKPTDIDEYTYLVHTDRLARFIIELGLSEINLFVQDWGSLIGLKVAGENPDWFASIAVGDGALPNIPAGVEPFPPVENPDELIDLPSPFADAPEQQVAAYDGCELLLEPSDSLGFGSWMEYAMKAESFRASEVLEALTWFPLTDAEEAAYDAPYPSREYMAGIRKFPSIVNELGGQTQDALAGLSQFEKPFITIWASNDAGNLGSCEAQQALIDLVPGAGGQAHTRLPESSHFLQDDQGEEIAARLVDFYEIPAPFPSEIPSETPSEPPQGTEESLGFEILEIVSETEIVVWVSSEITKQEFDALVLPEGWLKNQVREVEVSGGSFARSPDALDDGPLQEEELFGFRWRHNATIIETGITLDEDGLLEAASIEKFHTITFGAGSTLYILVAPSGEEYLRITRDVERTSETPTLPEGWSIREQVIDEPLELTLPNPTLNIRTDNQDSFQGPVSLTTSDGLGSIEDALNSGLLPLNNMLCEDPANMDVLLESPVFSGFATGSDNNSEQIQRMVESPTAGPFYMFNFIRFRELAVYADGRETDLTGQEANDIYNPIEFLTAIGARPVFLSAVDQQIEGEEPFWEEIAVVEYPCPVAFFAMILNPGFQDRLIHKNAGVETTWVIVTDLLPSALPEDFQFPESPFPSSETDPAFELIHLRDYYSSAQYEAGSSEPERSGEAAWDLFVNARSEAKAAVGSVPSVRLQIQGVFSGTTQVWDAIDIDFFPSNAAYEALVADETRQQALFHREAALAGSYSLITYPTLNIVPGVPEGNDNGGADIGSLPVTEMGVGQVCMSDADCVGIGTCINSGIGAGFCTRQCGAGECGSPYTCCGSCAAAVAAQLPFIGSACLPPDAAAQLGSAPASCSCQ